MSDIKGIFEDAGKVLHEDGEPLLVAKELTAEDRERIRAEWQARYGGRAVTDMVTPSPTDWRTDER